MIQFVRFLPILLPALASLIQAHDVRALPPCNSTEIHNKDVTNCDCRPHQTGCLTPCSTCGWDIKERHTKSCTPGCTDNDWNCVGCGVWFSTLCDCLKFPAGCPHTGDIKKDGKLIWVYLPKDQPLITTNDVLPGILEMAWDHERYKEAFDFAQLHYDPSSQALALNSVRSRTMEQFHIHVCPRPVKPSLKVIPTLDTAHVTSSTDLTKVLPDLYCVKVEKGKGPIKGFVEAIHNFIQKKIFCEGLIGAGIIQDSYQNTYGCVTNGTNGSLPYFCR